MPRGLLVEPTTRCSGGCPGCVPPAPRDLTAEVLERWLSCAPVPPATFAFAGKHSDPLCAPDLPALAEAASRMSMLVSVSTIGLGLNARHLRMPVDRWIVSMPGATGRSYSAVRGGDSLPEVLDAVRRLAASRSFQVEVVLTLWRPSEGDVEAFRDMARAEGWRQAGAVQGLYDPSGFDVGRPGMLATGIPGALYRVERGTVSRRAPAGPCPASGYLFLDAGGALRPCLFGDSGPCWRDASRQSWLEAASFERTKAGRPLPECEWCP